MYGLSGRKTPLILNLCTRRNLDESQTQSGRFGPAGDRPRIIQPVAQPLDTKTACLPSVQDRCAYLRFWYHVLTCVSVRLSLAASSILSCTLRYFCRSKLFSKVCNWWSVNAVRAFRCFLVRFPLEWPLLPPPAASSSLWPVT